MRVSKETEPAELTGSQSLKGQLHLLREFCLLYCSDSHNVCEQEFNFAAGQNDVCNNDNFTQIN